MVGYGAARLTHPTVCPLSLHYCGTTPSRPTLTRAASSDPSGFFTAPKIAMAAPGLSSLRLPAT